MSRRKQLPSALDDGLSELANRGYGNGKRLVFAEDGTVHIGKVTFTKVGMLPGAEIDESEYRTLIEILLKLEGRLQWMIGDALRYGEDRNWGETFQEVATALGREIGTIYNWASVCRKVEFSRRHEISFSHHTIVAPEKPAEQVKWLDRAEENHWSTRELLKAMNPPVEKSPPTFWDQANFKINQWVKDYNAARAGNAKARERALQRVDEQRKWLDEYERGLNEE